MLSRTLFCLAVVGASAPAFADTVWLKNGDRLTGTIKVFDGGKLLIETPYGGSIPVDMKQVQTLQTDAKMLVKQGGVMADEQAVNNIQKGDPGKVTLGGPDAPKTVDLTSITQIIKPKPLITDLVWKGNVDAALDFKDSDTKTEDYDISFKTSARNGDWRHNAQGGYNRETDDNVVATDNWNAQYSLDRFFTEKWYWDGTINYQRDKIADLSRQRTVGTGPGYQFWDDELGAFSLEGLLNRGDYEYSDGAKDHFYSAAMKWNYNRFLVGKTFEFFTDGELGRPLNGVADYNLDAEVGLRYKVTDWASLNLKASKNQVSGAQGDVNETEYTAGIGVNW